jgi:hypothetical protein
MTPRFYLYFIGLMAILAPVFSQSVDPGYNNLIQLGPNTYTIGFNLIIPNPVPVTQKYYEASGLSNHTTLFMTALKDLSTNKGGILQVRQGSYMITTQLELPSNFHFAGDGIGKTILQISNGFIGTSLLHTKARVHVAVTGLTLVDIENQADSVIAVNGLYIETTENVWVDRIEAKDFTGIGIKVHGRSDPLSRYLTITNSKAYNNVNNGFYVDQIQYNNLVNCVAEGNDLHGFYFEEKTKYTNITNCIAKTNGFGLAPGCGFAADDNNDVVISTLNFKNNQAVDNRQAGFCMNNINVLMVKQNVISGSPYCFVVKNLKFSEITNNQCSASTQLYLASKAVVATTRTQYVPETMVLIDATNSFTLSAPTTSGSTGSTSTQITPALRTVKSSEQTNLVTIGPNYYTIGYNLGVTTSTATTKFYSLSPGTNLCTAFQQALNDISTNGGGTLFVKAGTYTMNCNLILGSKLKLTGAGMDITIFKLANGASRFPKAGFLRTHLTSNLIIANLTVDGNKAGQSGDYNDDINYGRYGIFTEGCTNVWFDRVRVTNFQGYGFDPHGWKDGGVWGNKLTLTNCIANGNMWDGFTLDQSYNIIAEKCTSYDNGRHGFNIVTGSQRVKIVDNNSYNNGFTDPHGGSGCAYMFQNNQLFGTNDIYMVNNKGTNCKKGGLCINDIHVMETSKNTFDQMPGNCLDFVATTGTILSTTTCLSYKYYKIATTTISTNPATYDPKTQVLLDASNTFTKV